VTTIFFSVFLFMPAFPEFSMQTIFTVLLCWLLLNLLYVLIVVPARKSRSPASLFRAIDAIKDIFRSRRDWWCL